MVPYYYSRAKQGFTGLYSKMCDSMELKDVFYACVIPFLIFFASFALFIYPNRVMLHPHGAIDAFAAMLPANFAAPLSIIRNWSFAVFYVMAEMWGSVVASLLFWGFANEVTTVDEAKKYCTCGRHLLESSHTANNCEWQPNRALPQFSPRRSIVWTGRQCCSHLFGTVRAVRVGYARNIGSGCRRLGRFIEILDGGRPGIWGRFVDDLQVHAGQDCIQKQRDV
jgi:TLC ATP/ADP transporter